MDLKNIKSRERELFDRWIDKRPNLIPDGLVNESLYFQTRYKIIYILKETNGVEVDFDLRHFLRNGARAATWNNIAIWQYGLQNDSGNFSWKKLKNFLHDDNEVQFRKDQLGQIAAINVKKETGGHTANGKEIYKVGEEDENFIKEQLNLYDPDIIVCCGSVIGALVKYRGLVEPFDNWVQSHVGVEYHLTKQLNSRGDQKLIINYCHPAARVDDYMKYYPIISTVREIMAKNLHRRS